MKIFFDGANIEKLKQILDYGFIDGVTTNSSFLQREVKTGTYKDHIKKICDLMPDKPVSAYVAGDSASTLVQRAKEHAKIADNVVIKISVNMEGVKAIKILAEEGIKCNATCCMQPLQALLAAKAGAVFISPFVGRVEHGLYTSADLGGIHLGEGHGAMALASQIRRIYDNYNFKTEILVAATRDLRMVLQAALIGADICTASFEILQTLCSSSYTDSCIQGFAEAWDKLPR